METAGCLNSLSISNLVLLLIFGIANMITTTITAGITRLVIILGTSKTGTAKASSTSRNQFVNYYFLQ